MPASRYKFTVNKVDYVGELPDNRKSTVVVSRNSIVHLEELRPESFQQSGITYYLLNFANNKSKAVKVSDLKS